MTILHRTTSTSALFLTTLLCLQGSATRLVNANASVRSSSTKEDSQALQRHRKATETMVEIVETTTDAFATKQAPFMMVDKQDDRREVLAEMWQHDGIVPPPAEHPTASIQADTADLEAGQDSAHVSSRSEVDASDRELWKTRNDDYYGYYYYGKGKGNRGKMARVMDSKGSKGSKGTSKGSKGTSKGSKGSKGGYYDDYYGSYDEPYYGKGKGKGEFDDYYYGNGKGEVDDYYYGKGKGEVDDYYYYGKGKGEVDDYYYGEGKGKGEVDDYYDYYGKGKGYGEYDDYYYYGGKGDSKSKSGGMMTSARPGMSKGMSKGSYEDDYYGDKHLSYYYF